MVLNGCESTGEDGKELGWQALEQIEDAMKETEREL